MHSCSPAQLQLRDSTQKKVLLTVRNKSSRGGIHQDGPNINHDQAYK